MEFILEHPVLLTYLFLKIDALRSLLVIVSVLSFTATLFTTVLYFTEGTEQVEEQNKKWFKLVPTIFLISSILLLVVPSKQDVAIIVGVYAGAEAVKDIKQSPVTEKATKILNKYSEEALDEIGKKKKDGR